MGAKSSVLISFRDSLPFAEAGFGWIVPSIAMSIIFVIFDKMLQKDTVQENASIW